VIRGGRLGPRVLSRDPPPCNSAYEFSNLPTTFARSTRARKISGTFKCFFFSRDQEQAAAAGSSSASHSTSTHAQSRDSLGASELLERRSGEQRGPEERERRVDRGE